MGRPERQDKNKSFPFFNFAIWRSRFSRLYADQAHESIGKVVFKKNEADAASCAQDHEGCSEMVVSILFIEEAIRIETPMKKVIPEIILIAEKYFLEPLTHKYKHRGIEGNQ